MNLKATTKIDTNKYELEIEIPAADFDAAVNAAYKKEGKKMAIPGFRKGKAPRAFIEKYYGEGVFYDAAIDALYRPTVVEAIEASKLEVVSVGQMNITEVSKAQGLTFKLEVIVKPECKLEGYKGIEVTKKSTEVTEDDIMAEIKRVQERNSRVEVVSDRAVENGDIAVIDYEGFCDGVAFDGGKAENHELSIGSGQFIPGFEEQIIGHNAGEEFDINVKFPEEYHSEDLKGKDATFKIKLHEIKAKELPELDDDFVKDISEFDTVEEYKADIKAKLTETKEKNADIDIDNQLIDALAEKLEAEIPAEMNENEVNESINNFAYRLQSQGLNLDTYLKYTGLTPDALKDQFKDQAEKNVKVRLALETIVKLEGIEASDEEMEAEIEKLAKAYEMEVEKVKNIIAPEQLKLDITNEKAIKFVKENAVIKTEE
ncbi:MAG: trigger factor [Ruminococcaceae bacterium]|nr:trigger factor [Oscillospiraceae bacterium]